MVKDFLHAHVGAYKPYVLVGTKNLTWLLTSDFLRVGSIVFFWDISLHCASVQLGFMQCTNRDSKLFLIPLNTIDCTLTLPLFPVRYTSRSAGDFWYWLKRQQGTVNLVYTASQVALTWLVLKPSHQVLVNCTFTDTVHVVNSSPGTYIMQW